MTLACGAEFAHRIIVVLDEKDRYQVGTSPFRESAVVMSGGLADPRVILEFSGQDDIYLRAYEVASKLGLTTVCLIPANHPFTPPWLIRDCLYKSLEENKTCFGVGYPAGMGVETYPFYVLAQMHRYLNEPELSVEYREKVQREMAVIQSTGEFNTEIDCAVNDKARISQYEQYFQQLDANEYLPDIFPEAQ